MKTGLLYLINGIMHCLPETRLFPIKRSLLRLCGIKVGINTRICSSVRIMGNADLNIGDNVWIGHDTLIICSATVTIGDNVNIAPRCYLGTGTHLITPYSDSVAGMGQSYPITIENGAWICAASTILAGSKVGSLSIVAAGAVVKGIVQDNEMVGGVPARHIKFIK